MARAESKQVRFSVQYHTAAVVFTVLSMAFLVGYAVFEILTGMVLIGIGVILTALLLQFSWYPQWYTLSGKVLRFKSGIWTLGKVNLDEVTSIRFGKGWPVSHTLHPIRGIRLMKAKGSMFIIPRDEAAFFEAASLACPRLQEEIARARSGGNQ